MRSTGQQRHPRLVEPREERLGRERVAARRRQFDGEGYPIEALADRGDGACVGGVEGEVWADRASALDEEIHRGDGGQCRYGGRLGGGGQRKWRERIFVLAAQAQRRAARREDFDAGAGGEEIGDQRRRWEQVLEVVEQQEHRFVAQVMFQQLGERRLIHCSQAERAYHRTQELGQDRVAPLVR